MHPHEITTEKDIANRITAGSPRPDVEAYRANALQAVVDGVTRALRQREGGGAERCSHIKDQKLNCRPVPNERGGAELAFYCPHGYGECEDAGACCYPGRCSRG